VSTLGRGIGVRTLALSIQDAVVQHWAAATGDVQPLPDRRLIAAGDPGSQAWDCEQLVVSLTGIGFGPAQDSAPPVTPRAGSPASILSVRHAVFNIALVRCIPGPTGRSATPPSVEALNAAGERYMIDAGMLSQALVWWASRTIKSVLPGDGASSVQLGVIEAGEAAGNMVGMEASAIVTCAALE
jgi:hypothetical protein